MAKKPDATGKAAKLDLTRLHKDEYVAPKEPVLIRCRKARYLAVTGKGAPGGEEFQTCIGALYAIAYTVKMRRKLAGKGNYVMGKLEGQYWSADREGPCEIPPEQLEWRLLIRTPEVVGKSDLAAARRTLAARGKDAGCERVELIDLGEGSCVQMLHVGPYEQERRTIDRMLAWATDQGWQPAGRHHEIYLSDPRRVPPDRLRTILRMPVRKAGT